MKKESTDDEKWERITWYVLSNVQTGRMSLVDAQKTLDLFREDELKTHHQQLQKAREEEKEKWQTWVQHDVTCYLYTEEGDSKDCTCGLYHACQSELDQPITSE